MPRPAARPRSRHREPDRAAAAPAYRAVRLPAGDVVLDADLLPATRGWGTVLFAHGSGSGRRSPRNRAVARSLVVRGLGALLLDLLPADEARIDAATARYRFDIPRLTARLVAVVDHLGGASSPVPGPLGIFGASTGGAVALEVAARRPARVAALVLRGARSDLAERAASGVRCPTLLLVGGADPTIRRVNERTADRLAGPHRLLVVPGASHLFEEPGALERVADEAAAWFARHLAPGAVAPPGGELAAA